MDAYAQLTRLGADVKLLKEMNPTEEQLRGLVDGILKLVKESRSESDA